MAPDLSIRDYEGVIIMAGKLYRTLFKMQGHYGPALDLISLTSLETHQTCIAAICSYSMYALKICDSSH